MVHVNRGWNAVGDAGGSPGGGVTVTRVVGGGWTLTGSYLGGPEPSLRGGHSWLERRYLELAAGAGLPAPETQRHVGSVDGRRANQSA